MTAFLRENFHLLKEVYLCGVAHSFYPYFTWLDFVDYCINTIKVIDKNCTVSKIDMAL